MTKKEAIKMCKPPSDDWEKYADRLWDLSVEYGRSTALDEVLEIFEKANENYSISALKFQKAHEQIKRLKRGEKK